MYVKEKTAFYGEDSMPERKAITPEGEKNMKYNKK